MRETIDSTFSELARADGMSMEHQMQQAIDPLDTENLTKPAIEMIPINDNLTCDDTVESIDDLKELELQRIKDRHRRKKRKRLFGYVRSRKLKRKLKMGKMAADDATESNKKCINPASIDAMSSTIPKLELPYKKFRNAMFEIISQNEILEHRTRVHRRTLAPFDYKSITKQPQSGAPKRTQRSLPNTVVKADIDSEVSPAIATTTAAAAVAAMKNKNARNSLAGINLQEQRKQQTGGSRNRRRINYSEELVDEAFMYEQILQDKHHQNQQQQKRKHSLTKSLESKSLDGVLDAAVCSAAADAAASDKSGHIDSRLRLLEQRNEISIMPVRSRLMAKEKQMDQNHCMPIPIKTEPLFNITSSVSVHIKSRADQPIAQNIQISNITSLHKKPTTTSPSLAPSKKRRKISCVLCQKTFSDEKQLATHHLGHMKISAYKMDAIRILNPKLRRVSSKNEIITRFSYNLCVFVYFLGSYVKCWC